MSGEQDAQEKLLRLIEDGVSASAEVLAKVSHTSWSTQTVSIDSGTVEKVSEKLAQDTTEHYGAFAEMSGAVFMLMFPKKNSPKLAAAFMKGRKPRAGSEPIRESVVIAEISNIVLHAVANTMADACDMAFILGAPEMLMDKKVNLLKLAATKMKSGGEKSAITTYVHMSSETLSSDCTVLLLLSPSCRGTMLKALDR